MQRSRIFGTTTNLYLSGLRGCTNRVEFLFSVIVMRSATHTQTVKSLVESAFEKEYFEHCWGAETFIYCSFVGLML